MMKHFSHGVVVRAPGLLPLLYTPHELEEELGVPSRTIRYWMKKGMPFQKDEHGFIWVNGVEFAAWVEKVRASRVGVPLAPDEAYCFHCKQPVKLLNPLASHRGKLNLVQGRCPTCGSTINRGGRCDQSE